MFIGQAKPIAERYVEQMRPRCERIEIAGSTRRGCQDVGDIEIVVVPQWQETPLGLFPDGGPRTNRLMRWALDAEALGDLMWIKTGTSDIVRWQPKEDGKYWRALLLPERIKLDLFLASPQNYGLIFAYRTGCREFSEGLLAHAKQHTPYQTESSYYRDHPDLQGQPESGHLVESATGRRVATPEESDVFRLLGLEYVEPRDRTGFEAVRRARVLRASKGSGNSRGESHATYSTK